jgi:hypothetical protein
MASGRLLRNDDAPNEHSWTTSLFLKAAQTKLRLPDDQRTISTSGATCVDTNVDESVDGRSDFAFSDVASVARRSEKGSYTERFGKEATEDGRNSFSKRLRLLDKSIGRRGNAVRVGLSSHLYNDVHNSGNARVHMGDNYGNGTTINNNYYGLCTAMTMRLSQDIEPMEEAAILRLAAVIILAAVTNAIIQPFLLLRKALHRAIPHAVHRRTSPLLNLLGFQMVTFEDALGRFERIDTNVVNDWTNFHYNLTRSFADQPGYRRVAVAGYRLFGQAQGDLIINPKQPPPFASVFARNNHVRMSIHFEWSEVPLESCPKCGLKQTCELDKETTCSAKSCGFRYYGNIEDTRIVELDNDEDTDVDVDLMQDERSQKNDRLAQQANSRRRLLKTDQENPARFSRICVSRQPDDFGARLDGDRGISTHDFEIVHDDGSGASAQYTLAISEGTVGQSFEVNSGTMLSGFGDGNDDAVVDMDIEDHGARGQERRGSAGSAFSEDEQIGELSFDDVDTDYR